MGSTWSGEKQDNYIKAVKIPKIVAFEKRYELELRFCQTDECKFVLSPQSNTRFSKFKEFLEKPGLAHVIYCVRNTRVVNDFKASILINIGNINGSDAEYSITCPGECVGVVSEYDDIIYKHEIEHNQLVAYVGANQFACRPDIVDINEDESKLYSIDGLFMKYAVGSGYEIDKTKIETVNGNEKFYKFTKEEQAKYEAEIKDQLFDKIAYTNFKDVKITCDTEEDRKPDYSVALTLEFVVISIKL